MYTVLNNNLFRMLFTCFFLVSLQANALSYLFSCSCDDYERVEESENSDAVLISFVKENVTQQLAYINSDSKVNKEIFGAIINAHNKLMQRNPSLRTIVNKKCDAKDYYTRNSSCFKQPDWLDFSCEGSFLGRSQKQWCPDGGDAAELYCCFASFICYPFQVCFGACCPCGYTKNGCIQGYQTDELDIDRVSEFLALLDAAYNKIFPAKKAD